MAYNTLNVIPDRGGSRDSQKRGNVVEFVDGYKQEVIHGLKKTNKTINFSYTGTYTECTAIETFFDNNVTVPFYFRFMPQEPLRLYKVQDSYNLVHEGGLKWRITAVFYEYLGV